MDSNSELKDILQNLVLLFQTKTLENKHLKEQFEKESKAFKYLKASTSANINELQQKLAKLNQENKFLTEKLQIKNCVENDVEKLLSGIREEENSVTTPVKEEPEKEDQPFSNKVPNEVEIKVAKQYKVVQSNKSIKQKVKRKLIKGQDFLIVEDGRFKCLKCEVGFKRKERLTFHIMTEHEGHLWNCDLCNFSTKNPSKMPPHKQVKHEGLRFSCDKCEFLAMSQFALKNHKQSVHEGLVHTCDQCNHTTKSKTSMKHHMDSKHNGILYYCDQCEHKAISKVGLKHHREAQHEGKLYTCNHCVYSTGYFKEVLKHEKKKHGVSTRSLSKIKKVP